MSRSGFCRAGAIVQISPGGRFLAIEQRQADPPTGPPPGDQRVYDWTTGIQEVLPRVEPFTAEVPRVVQIAGGGRIFASTDAGGWFEYAAVPGG